MLVRLSGSDINNILFAEIMGITLFADGLENFFSLFYLGKIVAKAKEALDAEEDDKGDVYEDAIIADSYSIKDDDNVITVEILPNNTKEYN